MVEIQKPLLIFFINHDWRDIYATSFHELTEKLDRDRMNSKLNNFFFFSYAQTSYTRLEGQYQTAHIKTHLKKIKPLLDLTSLFRIPWIANRYHVRPQVWVVGDFGAMPGAWIAKRLCGGKLIMSINNQPVIYSRTRQFGRIKGAYMWLLQKLFYRLPDHYFTINNTMAKYLQDVGVPSQNITIFSMDTIERDAKQMALAQKGLVRARHHIPANSKVLLTVARLEAEKNYPLLLKLFSGLGPGYTLIALGRGSMLEVLRSQAEDLGISERVIFTGYIERNDIWNYYKDADVFVLLSRAEALGIVLWEAIYMGVPIVCSTVDGILETVEDDNIRARVWREQDGQSGFNERITFCVKESVERQEMLSRARAFVDTQLHNTVTINTLPIWNTP